MSISRRGFLKFMGGAAAAVAVVPVLPKIVAPAPTAPLYIPAQNLDMGVPRAILTATGMPLRTTEMVWKNSFIGAEKIQTIIPIPMLLVHDEFRPPGFRQFGRDHVPAGTTLMVDRPTAERWIEHGVGTPGQHAPLNLQEASAQRWSARWLEPQVTETRSLGVGTSYETIDHLIDQVGMRVVPPPLMQATRAKRDDAFDRMVKRATAKAARETGPDWWNSIPAFDDGGYRRRIMFGDDDAT